MTSDPAQARNLVARRPAETGGVGLAAAVLAAYAFGLDESIVAPLAIVVGFVPAAITWLVATVRGGTGSH